MFKESLKKITANLMNDYEFSYRDSNKKSHVALWICFSFFLIAFIWAYFAAIDEVTVAQGKVVPSKQIQLIQNLEGGIVSQILVQQGQSVEKGDILAQLDNTRFSSDFNVAKKKEMALKIKIARLSAQAGKKPLTLPSDLMKADPELAASEISQYQNQMKQIEVLKTRQGLIEKELSMTAPLVKEGAVSKVELLRLQQSINEINTQILTNENATLDELNKSNGELASLQQDMLGSQDRLTRTTVRSPVKGIINEIYVTTVGGIIKPGDNLMDIVPLDDSLLIEAKVRPADIGFLHIGEKATVKMTAYDFSIYGGLTGKLEHISADTIKDEKGENYYEIWVRTKQNYLRAKDGKPLYIIPGMTASVDILTGKKTVLDYILKPIIKAKQSALRER